MKFALLVFLLVRSSCYKVSFNKSTKTLQSRTLANQNSDLAIDGSRQTCSLAAGISKTQHAFWKVLLHKILAIYKILILFKQDEAIAPFYKEFIRAYVSLTETYKEVDVCSMAANSKTTDDAILLVCKKLLTGMVVTITKFGHNFHPLILCEVNVFAAGFYVVSMKQRTRQVTLRGVKDTLSSYAVDGRDDTCTRVYTIDSSAWWKVEFDDIYYINRIKIDFNQNTTVTEEQLYLKVYVSNNNERYDQYLCVDVGDNGTDKLKTYIDRLCAKPNPFGKMLTIEKYGGKVNAMKLCEVTVIAEYPVVDDKFILSEGSLYQRMACKDDELVCEVLSVFFCVSKMKICDKVRDCPNGIDEVNCTCPDGHFKCLNGLCIPNDWVCDEVKDCRFGDDEHNCNVPCEHDFYFICIKDRNCIKKNQRCDGHIDCLDSSDERRCFEMVVHGSTDEKYLLTTTYQGFSDYYICATNWENMMAVKMCYHLTGSMQGYYVEYKPKWINEEMLLVLKDTDLFENNVPSLKKFEITKTCPALVEIFCNWNKNKQCGNRGLPHRDYGPYIINGEAARLGAWPWQVQISRRGLVVCGGTIITENMILTSAACPGRMRNESHITVQLGTNKFHDNLLEILEVSHIINHPDHGGFKNDIGFLRLSKPLKFSNTVSPICLPDFKLSEERLKSFKYCVVTGFGTFDRRRGYPPYLMQGRMNLMSDAECAKNLADIGNDTEANYLKSLKEHDFVCAGSVPTRDGINICWADSGSPLVCKDRANVWYQVALATTFEFGKNNEECTNSLFTKIDHHLEFINAVLQSEDKLSSATRIFQIVAGMIPLITMSTCDPFCC